MSINDKLFRTRFVVDAGKPHILVDTGRCGNCMNKPCLIVCPAQCFHEDVHGMVFNWENCLECGSCRFVCPGSAVTWNYPRGGFGVCYRYG